MIGIRPIPPPPGPTQTLRGTRRGCFGGDSHLAPSVGDVGSSVGQTDSFDLWSDLISAGSDMVSSYKERGSEFLSFNERSDYIPHGDEGGGREDDDDEEELDWLLDDSDTEDLRIEDLAAEEDSVLVGEVLDSSLCWPGLYDDLISTEPDLASSYGEDVRPDVLSDDSSSCCGSVDTQVALAPSAASSSSSRDEEETSNRDDPTRRDVTDGSATVKMATRTSMPVPLPPSSSSDGGGCDRNPCNKDDGAATACDDIDDVDSALAEEPSARDRKRSLEAWNEQHRRREAKAVAARGTKGRKRVFWAALPSAEYGVVVFTRLD